MRRRKTLVPLAGKPQVAHIAAVLRTSANQLAMVGDPEAALVIGAIDLADPPGFPAGPLSGICAAVEWARVEGVGVVVVAACDVPLVAPEVFADLCSTLSPGVNVACAETADGLQPLVSVWRSDLGPWLRAELAGGHPAVRDVLARAGCARVKFDDPDMFLNVNTPEDLARAEMLLRARR